MKIDSPSRLIMTPTASKLLSNREYDIEFHGYLSNHAKHAIIALDRLQATEDRVQEYWDMYTSMTPYNLQLHPVNQDWDDVTPATLQQWKEWRGGKIHWQQQTMFVYNQLQGDYNGDYTTLLQDLVPDLLQTSSLGAALTHGIIHLGWGIDAQSPWMIAEGMAYLNFAAIGVDPKKIQLEQHTDSSPMESLVRVAQTYHADGLKETWVQKAKGKYKDAELFHPELFPAGFQWEVAKIFEEAHPVVTDMPMWLTTSPISELYESLYRTVTYLYLATRDDNGHGNFLLLHMITSLWALEHIMNVVDSYDPNKEAKDSLTRHGIAQWYSNMLCFIAASANGFPPVAVLQDIQLGQFDPTNVDPGNLDWSNVIDLAKKETEEHNIKLTYVMQELWHRYDNWHGFFEAANAFTTTPNIRPDTLPYSA
ncbi:DUF4243 domain containing protein [Nitzschia inconspicua]|uniref:DUF4243 domain containing protein n=1 Tax=Nitzschia inconspicua TaxID=303405 RepID=A0A9K3Q6R2_9STRA|nr:DUF4243 domain containing protein [Nitzschia inconspicua]KAG7344693.1 DUF4243 domain containing protein [Nitzschia inconspicua]KAG7370409.1 DUF4243 domain containing protein [Nitzschia inconspicua]